MSPILNCTAICRVLGLYYSATLTVAALCFISLVTVKAVPTARYASEVWGHTVLVLLLLMLGML